MGYGQQAVGTHLLECILVKETHYVIETSLDNNLSVIFK